MFKRWKLQKTYPYDFQSSGFEIVDKVRAELEDQSDWDNSSDEEHSERYCKERAAQFGIVPPFSEEQGCLMRYLVSRRAGPMIITYAWGTYAYLRPGKIAAINK